MVIHKNTCCINDNIFKGALFDKLSFTCKVANTVDFWKIAYHKNTLR